MSNDWSEILSTCFLGTPPAAVVHCASLTREKDSGRLHDPIPNRSSGEDDHHEGHEDHEGKRERNLGSEASENFVKNFGDTARPSPNANMRRSANRFQQIESN